MKLIVNKKRMLAVICLTVIVGVILSPFASVVSAAPEENINPNAGAQTAKELKLTQSYPENNDTHLQIENTGIKLLFDGDVIDDSVWENNSKSFTLTDKDNKEFKIKAYCYPNPKTAEERNYILVVVNPGQTLKSKSQYTLTVKKGLQSVEGKAVQEDIRLNFTTVDTEGNASINMGLMVAMVVGMIIMTVISTRREAKKKEETKEEKVNPYKVAKEKGKSVEEVIEKMERDKARKAKRLKGKSDDEDDESEEEPGVYRVKRVRKVSDGGSTYKTGKKAEAEKKAKEEAERKAKGTTNPKKKKKGKKKK